MPIRISVEACTQLNLRNKRRPSVAAGVRPAVCGDASADFRAHARSTRDLQASIWDRCYVESRPPSRGRWGPPKRRVGLGDRGRSLGRLCSPRLRPGVQGRASGNLDPTIGRSSFTPVRTWILSSAVASCTVCGPGFNPGSKESRVGSGSGCCKAAANRVSICNQSSVNA